MEGKGRMDWRVYIEDRETGQKRKVIVQAIHGEALTKAVEEDG